DACQAVGERHGRDVVPALSFALQGPLSEVIRGTPGTLLSMRGQECRAGGVDQQGAQRDIAPLGDATEPATFTAGVLTGSQAKPGSEGSTAWKAFDIADGSTDRGAAEQADAGDLAQLLNNRIGASEGCKVALDLLDVMLQLLDLAQQPSKGVEVAMSRAHPLAAQPMQNQDLLLLEGLCRHGADGGATGRLDQRRRVRTVSLVAPDVLAHVLRGQQLNRMPVCADPACPVVRTAAGLHEHAARRAVHKEGRKPCPIEP